MAGVKADVLLDYDEHKWREVIAVPENTLQMFITDKCNLRCPECFYSWHLGAGEMSYSDYQRYIFKYLGRFRKITLLGGEPTLHSDLCAIIRFNAELGLKTTIYTNGVRLDRLITLMSDPVIAAKVSIRIGVHGLTVSDKPLKNIPRTHLPVTIVYMVAKYNKHELLDAADFAEKNFNCAGFFLSSIREIDKTGDFWTDTERTVPMDEYAQIARNFVREYDGGIGKLHISTRGVLVTRNQDFTQVTACRFGSIMRDGSKIISPLDISINRTSEELVFDQQLCRRHYKCVLQKIVLERTR